MTKNYQQTLDWMFQQLPMYQRQGATAFKKDLGNITNLCNALDNPEKKLKFIHVGGTNGKGSVSHIIAGSLQSQGYRVGMYTSPHYKDFRERIKINGKFISKQYVTSFVNNNQELIQDIKPSFFEISVAMALQYFASENLDFVIMEVGLGGRLDSTNIINPMISVITNISFDHQSMLGNTLTQIAKEKAGIIKENTPTIIGQHQSTDHIFIETAKRKKSKLQFADDIIQIKKKKEQNGISTLNVQSIDGNWNFDVDTTLTAEYQLENIKTGLATIKKLDDTKTISIDIDKLASKFATLSNDTYYIGRWQTLATNPLTIADSAHNEDGIAQLIKQISKIKHKQLHFIIGTVNDKNINGILALLPNEAKYYFCKANIPRGLNADQLQKIAHSQGKKGKSYRSVKQAYAAARMSAKSEDFILIGGSIFVVAEAI